VNDSGAKGDGGGEVWRGKVRGEVDRREEKVQD